MRIGIPKEIKKHEYRVGMTPAGVRELVAFGHQVLVQYGAGEGAGFSDEDYLQAGGALLDDASSVYGAADLIVKVKEPQAAERAMLTPGQTIFTYLHLAPDREQTDDLLKSGATCIAYETVTADDGSLPLLAPMSEVAGRLSIQAGAYALQRSNGGKGVLLGGVPGVLPGRVVILGGGVVGSHAAEMAVGLGAEVFVLDKSLNALRRLDARFGSKLKTLYATEDSMEKLLPEADLVVGAVLVPGGQAPHLIQRKHLNYMKSGTVLVDVAIDQGGCFETSHPTTHDDPTFVIDGIVHYCVANMPGAVPKTSTLALTHATLPYVILLANKGVEGALNENKALRAGLNITEGRICCQSVAIAQRRG
ncbi:MAG: alanine dehydrogenase [Hahellaceae bacterium]|nr:alanine dehydrogenase [Hahellaceae bacterium]